MIKLLPLVLIAVFAGCRAHMLETHGDAVQLFKTGQEKPGRGGAIRWLSNGPGAFQRARKADAEKQMKAFCRGSYTVTAEGPRSKVGASMPIPSAGLELDQYWYAAFDCKEEAP